MAALTLVTPALTKVFVTHKTSHKYREYYIARCNPWGGFS